MVTLFGDKLNTFLVETFEELSIGSDLLMKELKASVKKRKAKRMSTQCGTSMLEAGRSASGKKTPLRGDSLETKSPRGSSRKRAPK